MTLTLILRIQIEIPCVTFCVCNINACPICHRWQYQCLSYLSPLAISMLVLSVTVCNINACPICHRLQYQCLSYLSPFAISMLVLSVTVCNINACPICHRLRDNHVQTSHYTEFQYLTLKMNVNDVENGDENVLKVRCTTVRQQSAAVSN